MIVSQLAAFALAPVAGADEARAVMELSVMDWAACAIAGRNEPVAKAVRALVADEGGRAEATVIGARPAPARAAALVNGTVSHALDYDDTHFAHIGHPSVAVLPAALAAGQRAGASLDEIVTAALVGAEASVRFGVWLGRDHYQTGFHQTATAGAFGATIAAARLLGLGKAEVEMALGLVSTRASGLKSQFGTMGKPFNAGIAASNGVEAALLASRGFVSNPSGVAGVQGFGPTHAGAGDHAAFDGMGSVWQFAGVSHKFHACCHGLHAMLEALGSLELSDAPVERVHVVTHPRWDRVCNIPSPITGLEAKFSYRLTAAMALSGVSTAALSSFSAATAADTYLCAIRDRVHVSFDPDMPESASVVEVVSGGQSLSARHDLMDPISLEARSKRLARKAEALLGKDLAEALREAVRTRDLEAFLAVLNLPPGG